MKGLVICTRQPQDRILDFHGYDEWIIRTTADQTIRFVAQSPLHPGERLQVFDAVYNDAFANYSNESGLIFPFFKEPLGFRFSVYREDAEPMQVEVSIDYLDLVNEQRSITKALTPKKMGN